MLQYFRNQNAHVSGKQYNYCYPEGQFYTKVSVSHFTGLFIGHLCIGLDLLVRFDVLIDDLSLSAQFGGDFVGCFIGLLSDSGNIFYPFIMAVNLRVYLNQFTVPWVTLESLFIVHHIRSSL
jgi:hypothetical protein